MSKSFVKRVFSLVVAAVIFSAGVINVSADSDDAESIDSVQAKSVYVCEMSTGKMISEKASEDVQPMGHMAKLMTALICAEELEKGKIKLNDEVTAGANANAKPAPQIWLEAGDKISVEDLLKSITIGNANDACTAIAEHLSGSEEKFVDRMNIRAKELNMENTYFADCCGLSEATVSDAKDIAKLASEVIKHELLTEYCTTWMDNVKGEAVELVNNNRLVRSRKGILGVKACAGSDSGECIVTAVKQGELSICVVMLSCADSEGKFGDTENLLDSAFEEYRFFIPEIDKEYLKPIAVENGQKMKVRVKAENFPGILLKAGESSQLELEADIPDMAAAPIKRGDKLGTLRYILNDECVLELAICAAEGVEEMNWKFGMKRCLYNLLKM